MGYSDGIKMSYIPPIPIIEVVTREQVEVEIKMKMVETHTL
jgi:hypothetical protein